MTTKLWDVEHFSHSIPFPGYVFVVLFPPPKRVAFFLTNSGEGERVTF